MRVLCVWIAVAIAGAVLVKCAVREPEPKAKTPEQIIESNPTGAGFVGPRPTYFRKKNQ